MNTTLLVLLVILAVCLLIIMLPIAIGIIGKCLVIILEIIFTILGYIFIEIPSDIYEFITDKIEHRIVAKYHQSEEYQKEVERLDKEYEETK